MNFQGRIILELGKTRKFLLGYCLRVKNIVKLATNYGDNCQMAFH